MSNFRPAGFSDDDSDSDDYGFYEKPTRTYVPIENVKKKLEINLQDAIIHGNLDDVKKIIRDDLNGNVNTKLDSGWTPLMHACFHAQDNIVHYLLDQNADPNLHSDSVTPIMVACSNSSANNDTIDNIVQAIIEKKCILNVGDKYGQTPLMRAIASGRVAIVQRLVDQNVNIEMRDQQGWTALFWAVHHNQPEVLELLISKEARLTEVDKQGRTPLQIAETHDYENITEILSKHIKPDEEEEIQSVCFSNQITSWHDFYPGISFRGRPSYVNEIPQLLYGMNCERLISTIQGSGMDMRSFLLMNETEMTNLGIDLPYERQRLMFGLKKFHTRGWKLNAVAGLYARKNENYSVLDCLTTLGGHLQQVYILEATIQYTLQEYKKIQNQLKFEPPDSPTIDSLDFATKKILVSVKNIKKEANIMKILLTRINKRKPMPADLIKEKSTKDKIVAIVSEIVVVCTVGILVYHVGCFLNNFTKK